jgi:hypothetical protein
MSSFSRTGAATSSNLRPNSDCPGGRRTSIRMAGAPPARGVCAWRSPSTACSAWHGRTAPALRRIAASSDVVTGSRASSVRTFLIWMPCRYACEPVNLLEGKQAAVSPLAQVCAHLWCASHRSALTPWKHQPAACYATLCYATLCYAALCCAMLHYATLCSSSIVAERPPERLPHTGMASS